MEIRIVGVRDDGSEMTLGPTASLDITDDPLIEGVIVIAQTSSNDYPQGLMHCNSFPHGATAVGACEIVLRELYQGMGL